MKAKKIFILIFTFIITIYSCFPAFAAVTSANFVSGNPVSENKNNLKVTGTIPEVKNLSNPVFQYKLNEAIQNEYKQKVSQASANKIKNLKFSYESAIDGNVLSILLYSTNISTSISDVKSFVINKSTNTYVTINTLIGDNGINYANKVIANKIKNSSKIKYFGKTTITENQAFYSSRGNPVVVFGAGQIAAASNGNLRFEIPASGLKNLKLNSKDYYVKNQYNVKMIPLRSTVEYFGYSTSWNSKNNSIYITKGNFSTKITVGRNSYYKGNMPKQLEFAPEIRNGSTYVPISFFSEILNLLFAVDNSGNVTISQYTL